MDWRLPVWFVWLRFEKRFGYTIIARENGFPFSWIFSLEEGHDGYLWASGDKGLVKFKPETGELVWYNRESGLPFEQLTTGHRTKVKVARFILGQTGNDFL